MNYVQRIVARQQKEYHDERYINYKKSNEVSKLKKSELEEKLDWLIESGYTFTKHSTLREKIASKTYSLTYNDHLIRLSYFDGSHYYWYTTNYHDDVKNIYTPNSFKTFKKMFKERTGYKMLTVFGKTTQQFKIYCPKPLYFISCLWSKYTWINNVCKEDYSSHYPCSAIGLLPDASTMIELEGHILPNETYKFAFYPDSGHVAVYNEFDSHNYVHYINSYSANVIDKKYPRNYLKKDTRTILMQEADFTLKEEIMHYYNVKCQAKKDTTEYHDAKIFLLKFIGMMEQCSSKMYASYPFAHLASVIKWRSNIKMFNTLKKIGYNNVIQVCVDGVIHTGKPVGDNLKGIGSLNTEISDARFIQRGINQYILMNDTQRETKHTGLDINTDSDNISEWGASPRINFIDYIKTNYLIEELL